MAPLLTRFRQRLLRAAKTAALHNAAWSGQLRHQGFLIEFAHVSLQGQILPDHLVLQSCGFPADNDCISWGAEKANAESMLG